MGSVWRSCRLEKK